MLTLNTALAAASLHDERAATHWLDEAEALSRIVRNDPIGNWECFSATNVQIWRVAIAVEHGHSGGAVLELAKSVQLESLGSAAFRKAVFFADVGRGLAREPKTRSEAVKRLRHAEQLAPQRIRNDGKVRHTLEVLHEQALASAVGVELRGMMARMGIPH